MASKYNQGVSVSQARFTKAPMGEIEFSKMYAEPTHNTTFNAGDIIPIYCNEVLPHDTFSVGVDAVIRQATLKVPSMDKAIVDIFAYFVPNRVVNKSWKNVMGENTNGVWNANKVSLAPLANSAVGDVQVPINSVADYYGFPTQQAIPNEVLASCHDLKFRGYLEIYNNYFRDQNYQPPIAYSKLNVYNGFFEPVNSTVGFGTTTSNNKRVVISSDTLADGSVGAGAIAKELYGSDGSKTAYSFAVEPRIINNQWRALNAPLKANKLHDYFTSVLPSPQKGEQVIIGLGETAPVRIGTSDTVTDFSEDKIPLRFKIAGTLPTGGYFQQLMLRNEGSNMGRMVSTVNTSDGTESGKVNVIGSNMVAVADLSQATGVSISDLRMSAAIQQVYEILGRGGSRYTEYINSFFGLDIDNPFEDIPTCLGHIRRDLDLFQTAQTSATVDGGSPQASLAAFGYTNTGGNLFTRTFLEHGYIHILAVIRHRNIYPSLMSRDNFRLEQMDFYQYPLANISEQPVYTREINPFAGNDQKFGYQEAWAEYRMEPDRVSGYMRPGVDLSLDFWNYADDFDSSLLIADGDWLQSNTETVLGRGTASSEEWAPQFKGKFSFKITKQRPMPTYSMAGLDIL